MPPKPGKKEVQKQQKKVVEDKTFGLKNKGKSAKVKQYVNQVQHQAKFIGKSREQLQAEEKKKQEREAIKQAKEDAELANSVLFKGMSVGSSGAGGKNNAKVDPKSILCPDFKLGNCNKGRNCKYSHDINIERKTAKIDLYSDPRENKQQDNKEAKTIGPTTDIICKHFLDAVEQNKYGFLWVCPNNGEQCQYRHALPPGYILKSKNDDLQLNDEGEVWTEIDEIEKQRKSLDLSKCTPLTYELLQEWLVEHKKYRAEVEEKENANKGDKSSDSSKSHTKKDKQMSGRALFAFNPNLFVDDADADEENYKIDNNEAEWSDNEDLIEFKQGETVDDISNKVNTALFMDSDDDVDDNDHDHDHDDDNNDNNDERKE